MKKKYCVIPRDGTAITNISADTVEIGTIGDGYARVTFSVKDEFNAAIITGSFMLDAITGFCLEDQP